MVSDAHAAWLTTSPAKLRAYREDIWMRESWEDALRVQTSPEIALRRHTYVLVKSETFATRQSSALLAHLRARGFADRGAVRVLLDRHRLRALWHYQLNSAPVATLAAIDLIVAAGPAVLVLLADEDVHSAPISASGRLAAVKGSTTGDRRPGDLRALMGASLPLFSFIHVPDEPADLVREIGVWFERPMRRGLFTCLGGGPAFLDTADAVLAQAESECPAADLDVERALAALRSGSATHRRVAEAVRACREQVGEPAGRASASDRDLLELVQMLSGLDDAPLWDRVTLAAVVVAQQRPVSPPLL